MQYNRQNGMQNVKNLLLLQEKQDQTMKKILFCACALLTCLSLAAQSAGHPGVQRTLSNENTTVLARDDDGYIWVGTQRGLNRFNGSTFKIWYQNDENSRSDD